MDLQTQFGEDRCTQFRVIVVTDPRTNTARHKPTYRIDNNTLRAKLSAQYNNNIVDDDLLSAGRIQ